MVVSGDRFEVVGKWKVAVYDHHRAYPAWERPFELLSPGDVFDLKTRRMEKLGDGTQFPPHEQTGQTNSTESNPPRRGVSRRTSRLRKSRVRPGEGGVGDRRRWSHERACRRNIHQTGGRREAKFVIVPTANGNRDKDGHVIDYKEEEVVRTWKRRLRLKERPNAAHA